jgi:hypothetical protein
MLAVFWPLAWRSISMTAMFERRDCEGRHQNFGFRCRSCKYGNDSRVGRRHQKFK